MEGLFVRALKERLTPALIQELRAAGLDVERPLLPAYSRAVVNATIGIVARALYPTVPIEEAWYQIGKQYLFGTKKTTLGSATLALLRVMGPKRALNRLARTFRTTNNYMEVDLRPQADGRFELDLRPAMTSLATWRPSSKTCSCTPARRT